MDPTTLALIFVAVSQSLALPEGLLSAICYVESTHNHKAVVLNDGGTPSVGVCQVKLSAARQVGYAGGAKRLQEPRTNIQVAGQYLAYQLSRYKGHLYKSVGAYNAGRYKSDRRGFAVNRKYIYKVFVAWGEGR